MHLATNTRQLHGLVLSHAVLILQVTDPAIAEETGRKSRAMLSSWFIRGTSRSQTVTSVS